MASNTHYLLFFSLLIIALNGCIEPKPDPCEIDYSFEIPGSYYPEKDTFLVGDTLWIELRIEDFMVDQHSMETFYVGDYDFPLFWGIYKIDTTEYSLAYNDFDFLITNGDISQTCSFCVIPSFERIEDNARLFKVAIIPQKPGVYQTNFDSDLHFSKDVEFSSSSCTENVVPRIIVNNGRNAENLYLINEESWFWSPTASDSDHIFWGVYPFAVVEP